MPATGGVQLHPPESSPKAVDCGGEDGRLLAHNFDNVADRRGVQKTGVPGEAATAATQCIASEWDAAAASSTETYRNKTKQAGQELIITRRNGHWKYSFFRTLINIKVDVENLS